MLGPQNAHGRTFVKMQNLFDAGAVKKKGSVAFSLSTLRNMMCCVRFQGT